MTRRRWALLIGLFAVTFAMATIGMVRANNQWSCWHWDHANIGRQVAASGYWGTILSSEFGDWDQASCINFGGGSEIVGDAGFYGFNGWLGIARILQAGPGCTIVQADALMNRSYLDDPFYGETADRHVTCQEVGHTVGLDHRRRRDQTCMNDHVVSYPDFDQHDVDVLESITDDSACSGGTGGDPCDNNGENGRRKCNDGIDNDGDGCIDGADPDCQ